MGSDVAMLVDGVRESGSEEESAGIALPETIRCHLLRLQYSGGNFDSLHAHPRGCADSELFGQ